jgi:multicomponent K+:H+ antiporter subunit D
MNHLIILPVLLPLLLGALMLLLSRRDDALPALLNVAACIAMVLIAIWLLTDAASGAYQVYALGNWPAPFGIVLVLDRLSALMLLLTALVALFSLLYACTGELRLDPHFHILYQFLLLGLNGAFLTGDLFNLFVFFEILLIASYGLLLRGEGEGAARTRATLHYVVLNLAGSSLFLIAVGILYGVTGTLNMADLAVAIAAAEDGDGALLRAGALLLLAVFALKAALLPLYFWLPAAYSNAAAPVAAMFAIMTKVGVYSILRVFTLIFGASGGVAAGVAEPWLLPLATITIVLGAVGAIAVRRLRQLISYLLIVSIGTMLAGVGLFTAAGFNAALYYLVHSTLITVCLYLLADVIARQRPVCTDSYYPDAQVTRPALLGGIFFAAAISMAGMPPLSGFFGKVLILEAAAGHHATAWLWGTILVGSLIGIIAMSRAGSGVFWKTSGEPRVLTTPAPVIAAILLPLAASPALVLFLQPVHDFTAATARQLSQPAGYIGAVLGHDAVTVSDGLLQQSARRGAP